MPTSSYPYDASSIMSRELDTTTLRKFHRLPNRPQCRQGIMVYRRKRGLNINYNRMGVIMIWIEYRQ